LAQAQEYTKVVVIGGANPDTISSVEVLNLADDGQVCPVLPDYPLSLEATTAAYYDGSIVACGGDTFLQITDKCFRLGGDLTDWEEVSPLPDRERSCSKSSIIDGKWLLSGGLTSGGSGVTDSLLQYDGLFDFVPPMPQGRACHCQVTVNSTHVFFTGNTPSTTMLNWETQDWSHLEDNIIDASYAACGLIDTPDFGAEIVVADRDEAAIFSLRDLAWKEGPSLPIFVDEPASVQLSNAILAVGGFDREGNALNTVYKFDPDSFSWSLQDVSLSVPRYYATAVAVPDSFLSCQ